MKFLATLLLLITLTSCTTYRVQQTPDWPPHTIQLQLVQHTNPVLWQPAVYWTTWPVRYWTAWPYGPALRSGLGNVYYSTFWLSTPYYSTPWQPFWLRAPRAHNYNLYRQYTIPYRNLYRQSRSRIRLQPNRTNKHTIPNRQTRTEPIQARPNRQELAPQRRTNRQHNRSNRQYRPNRPESIHNRPNRQSTPQPRIHRQHTPQARPIQTRSYRPDLTQHRRKRIQARPNRQPVPQYRPVQARPNRQPVPQHRPAQARPNRQSTSRRR